MTQLKPVVRDEHGLIPGVTYHINEQGSIDWRKMVDPKFLTLNLQYKDKLEEVYGKPIEELKIEEVDDKYLLILLGGIKELARLRGFNSVTYKVHPIDETFVAATCEIEWLPNFETEFRKITFGDGADASNGNTTGFGKSFLTTIAVNRAFVRAVRNFLGVNVVGSDEIIAQKSIVGHLEPVPDEGPVSSTPNGYLLKTIDAAGLTFEQVKKTCIATGDVGAEKWLAVYDVPKAKCFELINRINNRKK